MNFVLVTVALASLDCARPTPVGDAGAAFDTRQDREPAPDASTDGANDGDVLVATDGANDGDALIAPDGATHNDFVQARGTQLMLNGRPWRFIGYDEMFSSVAYCTGPLRHAYTAAGLEAEMQRLQGIGVTAVRVWFFEGRVATAAGTLDFAEFDRILASARAHGLRVIATLGNGRGGCDPPGPGQTAGQGDRTLDWYVGSATAPAGYTQRLNGQPFSYREYVQQVARHYAAEPTVAWWELLNEPTAYVDSASHVCTEVAQPDGGPGAVQALHDFIADVATVIKTADSNHLISFERIDPWGGICGMYADDYVHGTRGAPTASAYVLVHDLPYASDYAYLNDVQVHLGDRTARAIDVLSIHEYPDHVATQHSEYVSFMNGTSTWLGNRIADSRTLDRPLYLGETGMCAPAAGPTCVEQFADADAGVLCADRASCFDRKFATEFDAGLAGIVIWNATPGRSGQDGDVYSVGHLLMPDGSAAAAWDPLDAVIARHTPGL